MNDSVFSESRISSQSQIVSTISWASLGAITVVLAIILTGCGDPSQAIPEIATAMAARQTRPAQTPTPQATAPAELTTRPTTGTRMSVTLPPPTSTATAQSQPTATPVTPQAVALSEIAWSPDGRRLAVGSGTGVYFYDAQTWQEARFIPLDGWVESVSFSFDGQLLGTAIHGQFPNANAFPVLSVVDGRLMHVLKGFGHHLRGNPAQGPWAAISERGVSLWQLTDGQPLRDMPRPSESSLLVLNVSPDGKLIAAGAEDGTIGIWDAQSGRRVAKVVDPDDGSYITTIWTALAFRPDGSELAAGGGDDLLVLWNAHSGRLIRRLFGGTPDRSGEEVTGLVFSPNGELLVSSHSDRTIRVWQADGTLLRTWQTPVRIESLAFGPDGALLAANGSDAVFLWHLDGTLQRTWQPVWHAPPTPTPTPIPVRVMLTVDIPSDWTYYEGPGGEYTLRYPPQWVMYSHPGQYALHFLEYPDYAAAMSDIFIISVDDPFQRTTVQEETSLEHLITNVANPNLILSSGPWPYLIPGNYAEFDDTWNGQTSRQILLLAPLDSRHYVRVDMRKESGEISEQVRQQISRVVASITFTGKEPATPTLTSTQTPASPAGPP